MTARSFAALVGVILIVVGLAGLLWEVKLPDPDLAGEVTCSNSLTAEPWNGSSKLGGRQAEKLAVKCADAAFPRRVIFWPLAGVGAITLAGALLIRRGTAAAAPAGKPTT
ncbi:hypothetical protein [Nocardia asteroides]|uniref:hypothetical protein n=1 Tax=Nocardia asteroides TaxID=1824 RepID=UPI0033D0B6CF